MRDQEDAQTAERQPAPEGYEDDLDALNAALAEAASSSGAGDAPSNGDGDDD